MGNTKFEAGGSQYTAWMDIAEAGWCVLVHLPQLHISQFTLFVCLYYNLHLAPLLTTGDLRH